MTEPASRGRIMRRGFGLLLTMVRMHPKPFLLAFLGSAVYGLCVVGSSYLLGVVTDEVIIPRFENGAAIDATVVASVLALFAVGILKASATVLRRCMAAIAKASADASLREQVVRQYQALPYEYHQRNPTGQLLAHANADPEAAAEVPAKMPLAGGLIVLFVVAGIWIFVTDPLLAGVGVLIVPALIGVNAVYQRRIEPPAAIAQERMSELSVAAHESFDGALTVKVLGAEDSERARFAAVARRLRDAKVEVAGKDATFDVLLESIPTLGILALVVAGSWQVNSGAITVGVLVSFINLFTLLTFPLRVIGYTLGDLPRSLAGYDRVRKVIEHALPADPDDRDLPCGPLDLAVAGASFAYSPGTPCLTDIDFTLPAGSTLAVVGPTGCGKTTLLLLLARLFRLDSGQVWVGGVDLASVRQESLTSSCAVVFQEPFLFDTSLRENILLGFAADDDEVTEAIRLAGIDEFVAGLPDGLRTRVGERGVILSGGQRQRVALARALVRRPRLLLLDEATSSVDPTTEARILRGLATERAETTTVIVTNRMPTLMVADQVLYLEGGRLIRAGTHQYLMTNVPGYHELVHAYEIDRIERES